MADKKYKLSEDYWETSGVYDNGQDKTQRVINEEVNTKIGNIPMGTTATTLTGAIAEHEVDISSLNGAITSLRSDDIANDSTNVSGSKVTDALDTLNGEVTSLQSNIDDKILYFSNQTVSAATSAQIMRIPSSGTNSKITTDTVVLECVFADHSAISGDVTWTSYSGYVAFTGTCKTATTANVVLGIKGN